MMKLHLPDHLQDESLSQWQKFDQCKACVDVVINGDRNGLLLAGQPGIGKSRLVLECLDESGYIKNMDWIRRKGRATVIGFYTVLYENHDKILVFDDYDAILRKEDGINILKAVLDDEPIREVSCDSPALDSKGVPRHFEFEGKIIFISNLDLSEIDSAVYTRCIKRNLVLTPDEILARMYELLPYMAKGVSDDGKLEIVDILNRNRDELYDDNRFNLRVFNNAASFFKQGRDDWMELALESS